MNRNRDQRLARRNQMIIKRYLELTSARDKNGDEEYTRSKIWTRLELEFHLAKKTMEKIIFTKNK